MKFGLVWWEGMINGLLLIATGLVEVFTLGQCYPSWWHNWYFYCVLRDEPEEDTS